MRTGEGPRPAGFCGIDIFPLKKLSTLTGDALEKNVLLKTAALKSYHKLLGDHSDKDYFFFNGYRQRYYF